MNCTYRMTRIICWSVVCVVLCGFVVFTYIPPVGYVEIGAFQVLEGKEEVWVFCDVQMIARRPWGDPYYPQREQMVFILRPDGIRSVAQRGGVVDTFNPNIATIFATENGMFLFQEHSANTARRFYRWEDDTFVPLSNNELGPIDGLSILSPDLSRELGKVSLEHGWYSYTTTNASVDAALKKGFWSEEKKLRIWPEFRNLTHALIAESSSKPNGWVTTLVEVDRSLRRVWTSPRTISKSADESAGSQ